VLLLHENASAHRALAFQKKIAYAGFKCFDHPRYSPDVAPFDYHLRPGLKKEIKVRHVSSDMQVITAARICLDGQKFEFFLVAYKI
jgi:hypothetical protein